MFFAAASGQPFVQVENPNPSFGIFAAEAGGGIVGALGLGGGFALATIFYPAWIDDEGPIHWRTEALAGISVSLALVGCAGGTYVIGSAFDQGGKFLPTRAYAAGTSAIGLGLIMGGTQLVNGNSISNDVHLGMSYTGIALLAATPVVAAYGYNRSRPRGSLSRRFVPGSVGLASVRDAEGIAHPSLNVRLLSVRF